VIFDREDTYVCGRLDFLLLVQLEVL
jgi:hypothetical protein